MRGTKSRQNARKRSEIFFAYVIFGLSVMLLGFTSQALAVVPRVHSRVLGSQEVHRNTSKNTTYPFVESTHDELASVVQTSIATIAEDLKPIDCSVDPCVALTFDDGPDRIHTPALLSVLKKHRAHASFFVIGNKVAGHEDIIRRIAAEGHDIGNHSWAHPNMTKLTVPQMDAEFNQTQAALVAAGVQAPHLFRPPYGKQNDVLASRIPVSRILWNVDPHDWAARAPEQIAADLLAAVRSGAIVVMHDTNDTAADTLAIESLSKSYKLVTVTKLLNLQPGDRSQYFGR